MNIIKSLVAVGLILNIFLLIAGAVILNDVFSENTGFQNQKLIYQKKEEDLLDKIDIVRQSKVDVYSNLNVVNDDIASLKDVVGAYSQDLEFASQEKAQLETSLSSYTAQNKELEQRIALVKTQIAKQKQASVIRTTTRSS